jgi:hypothetical protein
MRSTTALVTASVAVWFAGCGGARPAPLTAPDCPPCERGCGPAYDGSDAAREPGGCANGDRDIAADSPCALSSLGCRWTEPFRLSTFPRGYAVAATSEEIALAVWSGTTTAGPGCLRIARYRASLEPVSLSGCLGPESLDALSFAPSPSGWLVMVLETERGGGRRVTVHRLAPGGTALEPAFSRPASHARLEDGNLVNVAALVARPDGPPLAIWNDGPTFLAAVLGPDGALAGPPTPLAPADPVLFGSGWTGEAFALLRYAQGHLVLTRVAADGAVATDHPLPVEAPRRPAHGEASFAWAGRAGYALFEHDDVWSIVAFDESGRVLRGPVALEPPVRYARFGPVAPIGGDALVFERDSGPLHAATTPSPLRVRRFGAGGLLSPLVEVTRDPFPSYRDWFAAVPMGSDTLVAWSATRCTSQYVALARLPAARTLVPPAAPDQQQQQQ